MGGEDPIWVSVGEVLDIHDQAIESHGGRFGLRSEGLLDQALFRPRHIRFYEDTHDIARLTSCYAASVVQIHPFYDGNKRTGWGTANLFAFLNGWKLECGTSVATWMMLGYASHQLDEEELTDLVGRHLYQLQ